MMKKMLVISLLVVFSVNIISSVSMVFATESTIKIEGEWCNDYNGGVLGSYETATLALSGGRAASVENSVDDMPAGGYLLNYTVHVSKAGMYSLAFVSTKQGIKDGQTGGSDSLSPFYVNINDSDDIGFNDSSKVKAQDLTALFVKYSMTVGLDQGLNKISFRVREKRSLDNLCVFYLDYFQLDLLSAVFDTNAVRVEGENYSSSSKSLTFMPTSGGPNANYSMGWGVEMKNTVIDPPNGVHALYDFFAPEAGTYSIYTVCTTLGLDYGSNFSLKVNDNAYMPVSVSTTNKLAASAIGSSFQYYTLKQTSYLNKGHNTLDVWVNQLRTKDNAYLAQVDYIEFKRASSDINTESEWSTDKTFTSTAVTNASGGKDMQLNKTTLPTSGNHYVKSDFYISDSTQYSLYLNAALNLGSTYYSPVEIKFDDGEFTRLTLDNTQLISALEGMTAPYSRYLYKTKIPLTVGSHSFTLQVREMASAQNKYVCSFDKFDLIADKNLAGVRANLVNPTLTVGGVTTVRAYPFTSFGEKLSDEAYTLTYSSDDVNVAVVDATGTVTAINPGKTRINVIASKQGEADQNGYTDVSVIPSGTSVDVDSFTVTTQGTTANVSMYIYGIQEQVTPATVVASLYARDNDMRMCVKDLSTAQIAELHNGLAKKVIIPLQNSVQNDAIKIFVWDNMSNIKPLSSSIQTLVQ